MKKSMVDFMVEKLGGVEAVQKQFEMEKPVRVLLDLPADLAEKVQAEASTKKTTVGHVIQDALLEYFTSPATKTPQFALTREDAPAPKPKAEAKFRVKKHHKRTKTEIGLQESEIFTFLVHHKGKKFYSHQVAEHFIGYDSAQVSQTLRRLSASNRIKKAGLNRGTKYYVNSY